MNLRTMMLAASLVLATACVKKAWVTEKQPVVGLAAYKSASVSVDVPSSMTNAVKYKTDFDNALVLRLREKKVFADVPMEGGEVTIKVSVTKLGPGNTGAAVFGGSAGRAEIAATVELFDKDAKPLGSFDVTADSATKRYSNGLTEISTSSLDAVDDRTKTACEHAADQIVDYLEMKR